MKPIEISDFDKAMLRKRSLVEAIDDRLKNISQIGCAGHRCLDNFMVNLVAGLIVYTWRPKKPSLNLHSSDLALVNI
jgi:hypothetical protein